MYGYYFNNSPLNSNDCNQQINRIRFPISFNLYIERTTVNLFKTLEECENYITSYFSNDLMSNNKFFREAGAINNLLIYDEYIRSYFDDIFYYLPYLLKKKTKKYSGKEYIDIIKEEYNNGSLDTKKSDITTIYLNSFGFNKRIVNNNPKLLEIEK